MLSPLVSIMLAQQAMNKRQMPGGLTPQQQQQHQVNELKRKMIKIKL